MSALIYGPVPSRRFGLSLGVDLVPHKVCCYDCLYCQVGPTTELTTEPASFYRAADVVQAVEQALSGATAGPAPEIITLAGSGEPTLYQQLDQIEQGLRAVTALPLALLTNGALLWRPEVAEVAQRFDLVAPSLDAADPETWQRVNRPPPGLAFEQVIEGLRQFCDRFNGRLRLEVLLVKGVNDGPTSLQALADLTRSLSLEAVDLNTVVRPPAFSGIQGLDADEMHCALQYFSDCPAEIVGTFTGRRGTTPVTLDQIRQLVARRPCTASDLHASLGLQRDQIEALCARGVDQGLLQTECRGGHIYYTARPAD
jgi:wyosine [tRNA(Phe)-imidazoG37] synthetase (radical SAM superfamily)